MATVNRWAIWLGIVLGPLFAASLLFQAWQLWRFVHQGPRFTAQDGQALCERVRALEDGRMARDAGKTPLDCEYNKR